MAKSSGLGDRLYVHGYDLSGDVGSIQSIASPRPTLNKTGINSSANERIIAHGNGLLEFAAHFNDANDQMHEALSSLPTTDRKVMYCRGATAGNPMAALTAKQVNYDGNRSVDGDLQFSVQCMSQGVPLEWGKQVTAGKVTHASATSSTSIDENGATGSSAQGGVGFIQVFSIGSGTPTFVLEDSTDNSVWATLISFGADAAQSGDRITVTGNVDRYLRATTTGTFTDAAFAMGFRRGTAADDESLA